MGQAEIKFEDTKSTRNTKKGCALKTDRINTRSIGEYVIKIVSSIKFIPFETSTAEGRSKERFRRVALTTFAAAGARAINILAGLISVPLTVVYLGGERYGLWITMNSLILLLAGFADFGMGNGLVNAISAAYGKDDRDAARRYVSSAFFMFCGISFFLGVIFYAIYPSIPWAKVFNISSPKAIAEVGPSMYICMVCFLLNLSLGIVNYTQIGYQEGFINNLWQAIGNLFSLGGILVAIFLKAGLPWLVLAMVGPPVFAGFMNGIALFGFRRPWLFPRLFLIDLTANKEIAGKGILFFLSQAGTVLLMQAPFLVITRTLGPTAVTPYAIAYKLISIATMIFSFSIQPLWPAYGEAFVRQDYEWIRRTFQKSVKGILFFSFVSGSVFILLYKNVITLWVNADVVCPPLVAIGLSLFLIFNSLRWVYSMCLNGCNHLIGQAFYQIPIGAFGVICATHISKMYGISGVALAFAMAESFVALCLGCEIAIMFRKMASNSKLAADMS